jgi:hypothetical protein
MKIEAGTNMVAILNGMPIGAKTATGNLTVDQEKECLRNNLLVPIEQDIRVEQYNGQLEFRCIALEKKEPRFSIV